MFTVVTIALIGLLLWQRKKIKWGFFFMGLVAMCLLMGTAMGPVVSDSVNHISTATQSFGQDMLGKIGIHF